MEKHELYDSQVLVSYTGIVRAQITENWNELNSFVRLLYGIITISILAIPFLLKPDSNPFASLLFFVVGILCAMGVAYLLTFRQIIARLYKVLIKVQILLGLFKESQEIRNQLPPEVLELLSADEVVSILPKRWMVTPQILEFGPNIWTFNLVFFIAIAVIYFSVAISMLLR